MIRVKDLDFAYGKHQVLKGINFSIDEASVISLIGPNGSGKSTLRQDTLLPRLMYELYRTRNVWEPHESLSGFEQLDKVSDINQSPIGRTPRSNPATYTGTFDMIRELFSLTQGRIVGARRHALVGARRTKIDAIACALHIF